MSTLRFEASGVDVISHARLKKGFAARPLVVDDRIVDTVPVATVRIKHVLSEVPLLLCAETQDGGTGFLVVRVGLELDAAASENFEGVPQLQELGLGVDVRTLKLRSNPCETDLEPALLRFNIVKAGRADGFGARYVDGPNGI